MVEGLCRLRVDDRTGCRRLSFVAARTGYCIAAGVTVAAAAGRAAEPAFKTTLHKAVILGKDRMNEDTFKKLKDVGIEGFEAHTVPVDEAKKARELAEKFGLRIHSVMRG